MGKEKSEAQVFVTTTKGTYTKGKECAYAHVRETSSPEGQYPNSLLVLRTRDVQARGLV